MGRRFSDIQKAKELETGFTNFKNWNETRFDSSVRSAGGALGDQKLRARIFVRPFGSFSMYYQTTRGITSDNRLQTIGGRVLEELPANEQNVSQFVKGNRPSRVYLFEGTGGRTRERSKITNLFYIKYSGNTYSSPIGALAANEAEPPAIIDAFEFLQGLAAGKEYIRTWYKPQVIL